MPPHGDPDLEATYASYAASARKQEAWRSDNPGNLAIRRELVSTIKDVGGEHLRRAKRVIDVGCGSGWWLEQLAVELAPAAALFGVDRLAPRVRSAAIRVPQATVAIGDARALGFDDGHFDAVFLFTVLSSMASRDEAVAALREARRVLAPDGVLFVWEPRVRNPLNRHTQLITRRILRDALGSEPRFRSTTVFPLLARRLGQRTDRLYELLLRIPLVKTHRLAWLDRWA